MTVSPTPVNVETGEILEGEALEAYEAAKSLIATVEVPKASNGNTVKTDLPATKKQVEFLGRLCRRNGIRHMSDLGIDTTNGTQVSRMLDRLQNQVPSENYAQEYLDSLWAEDADDDSTGA